MFITPYIHQYLTIVLIIAKVFWTPIKPTFVFFSVVRNKAKLHSESKYEDIFDNIENFDFLFFVWTMLAFYDYIEESLPPTMWALMRKYE